MSSTAGSDYNSTRSESFHHNHQETTSDSEESKQSNEIVKKDNRCGVKVIGLPKVQIQGDVVFISGGFGLKVMEEGYCGGHSLFNLIYDVSDIRVQEGGTKLIHVNFVPNYRFQHVQWESAVDQLYEKLDPKISFLADGIRDMCLQYDKIQKSLQTQVKDGQDTTFTRFFKKREEFSRNKLNRLIKKYPTEIMKIRPENGKFVLKSVITNDKQLEMLGWTPEAFITKTFEIGAIECSDGLKTAETFNAPKLLFSTQGQNDYRSPPLMTRYFTKDKKILKSFQKVYVLERFEDGQVGYDIVDCVVAHEVIPELHYKDYQVLPQNTENNMIALDKENDWEEFCGKFYQNEGSQKVLQHSQKQGIRPMGKVK